MGSTSPQPAASLAPASTRPARPRDVAGDASWYTPTSTGTSCARTRTRSALVNPGLTPETRMPVLSRPAPMMPAPARPKRLRPPTAGVAAARGGAMKESGSRKRHAAASKPRMPPSSTAARTSCNRGTRGKLRFSERRQRARACRGTTMVRELSSVPRSVGLGAGRRVGSGRRIQHHRRRRQGRCECPRSQQTASGLVEEARPDRPTSTTASGVSARTDLALVNLGPRGERTTSTLWA